MGVDPAKSGDTARSNLTMDQTSNAAPADDTGGMVLSLAAAAGVNLTPEEISAAASHVLGEEWQTLKNMPTDFFPRTLKRMHASGNVEQVIKIAAAWIRVRRVEMCGMAAVRKAVLQIVAENLEVLTRQRRLKLYQDAYGRTIAEEWFRELHYFVANILIPGLDELAQRVRDDPNSVENGRDLLLVCPIDLSDESMIRQLLEWTHQYVEQNADSQPPAMDEVNSPMEFEAACVEILRKSGWNARRTGCVGDQGADVIASRDGITVVFQCKLYSIPVGNSAVQEVHAAKAIYGAHAAAVVSPSGFTKSARQAAAATNVHLLDVQSLSTFVPEFTKR